MFIETELTGGLTGTQCKYIEILDLKIYLNSNFTVRLATVNDRFVHT